MAKRDDLVKAYIGALDAAVVSILSLPDGKSGLCPGLAPAENPFDVLWFAKAAHAELVLAQCPEGYVDLSPAALRDEVVNAAAALGAPFRTSAEMNDTAGSAIDEIDRQVEALKVSGQLKQFNSGYKAYRLAMQGTGKVAIQYGDYLHGFKLRIAAIIGRNVSAGTSRYAGVLDVFTSFGSGLNEATREAERVQSHLKNTAPSLMERLDSTPRNSVRRHPGKMRPLRV